MKHMPLFFVVSLLFMVSCQEKKSSSSNTTSTTSTYGTQCIGTGYYTVPGCPGYSTSTTGGTTGSTQNICYLNATNYYQLAGCPGFCQSYPTNSSCTSGTTTGGTTGGSTTNPYTQYPSSSIYANWGVQYPGGVPAENCSASYSPSGISYTAYDTRKATMSIQGKTFYSPAAAVAPNYTNTSSILKTVAKAKTLFETDSVLKVRFKPRPQPENTSSSPYCYIPSYTKMSSVAGYTKLTYSVVLVGTRADGSTDQEPVGTFTTDVNSCTPSVDLSSYASQYPGGVYLIVQSVRGNQGVYPNDYGLYGFKNSNTFTDIRSMDCWVIDVEVAADGTKTFD